MAAAKTILILESNPWQDLSLNQEIRDLTGVIERARDRDAVNIEQGLAVRTEDLQELMLRHEPQIVHCCGHGSGEDGLVLQDAAQQPVAVATEALSNVFGLCKGHVDCVVLNACYSEVQAEAIVEYVDYAIGMQQTIRDDAAQHFAQGFYRALGYGKSVEVSYEWGCNAIQLMLASGTDARRRDAAIPRRRKISRVAEGGVQEPLPEYLKPRLFRRSALGAAEVAEVAKPSVAELEKLGQALEQEDALEQYREKVREFLEDRKLSPLEKIRLGQLRQDLGLSEAVASQILAEELEPILKAQERYESTLLALIEAEQYPFDKATQEELAIVQQELMLPDEEVEQIAQPILEAALASLEERLAREDAERQQEEFASQLEEDQTAFENGPQVDSSQDDATQVDDVAPLAGTEEEQLSESETEAEPIPRRYFLRKTLIGGGVTIATLGVLATIGSSEEKPTPDSSSEGTNSRQSASSQTNERKPAKELGLQKMAKSFKEDLGNGVELEMVQIPAGKFLMGSLKSEEGHDSREGPQHEVTVSAFSMGKFEVTQAQYQAVMGNNPSKFKGEQRPVEQVSWDNAQVFCKKLSEKVGREYRLPSEAEWEYACRAGTTTPFHFGETISTDLANYRGQYVKYKGKTFPGKYGQGKLGGFRKQTTEVGSFPPNAFGVYDMHGTVWEWCSDRWHDNYRGAPTDGSAWGAGLTSKKLYALRGGSWISLPRNCRSAYRLSRSPSVRDDYIGIGFRVSCVAPRT